MRAPSRPQKTTRQRMAHSTPVAPKTKLGKPSFFNALGKSILTTFSPKSAERRQPAADDDCSSDDAYYEDENDYLVEPKPLPVNPSFEEDRAAFLSKGKGLPGKSNTIRNSIGETSSQRQDDWAHAVGKSLPRTPVTHTRLYPELNADVEGVELHNEKAPEQPGPGLTVRKSRNIRVKGQPPTRVSERNRNKAFQPLLFGSAGDCITTFQLNYPREAKSFIKVKQNLHERFHGGDNRKMYFTEFKNCIRNSGESIRDYACRLQKLYSFAYPTEGGKTIDADVLKLRETMLMDGFLGGLKPNLRERMSFKDYRNLNDLVKATEKCAAILNEAKLEKRSVEFVNAVSANANTQELRETKNEISELKSAIEQLSQKMRVTQLADKSQESINAVTTAHNAQLAESKREIEELKNLLKASNKSYSDMMKQSRDAEKMMRNLQLQVAGMSQAIPQAQPTRQYQQNHNGLVIDNGTQFPHQPPVHRNPPPSYKDNHNNQTNGPPHRGERYCAYCANNGRNPTTHNTDKCGWGPNGPTCFKCHQGGHIARDCPSAPVRSDARYAPPAQNPGQLNPWNQEN
ncbi:hypothetical protein GHT06_011236 [Daphnia sinensis]|uniref:CCHC-type domain-containing protein n=1 Tax=Daphnia sinensis TaxID=1820382 RepID=A0AAD5L0B6_9CRUS|nr:hypothetical protein GHT06_011236 [Daphnia sinensis]